MSDRDEEGEIHPENVDKDSHGASALVEEGLQGDIEENNADDSCHKDAEKDYKTSSAVVKQASRTSAFQTLQTGSGKEIRKTLNAIYTKNIEVDAAQLLVSKQREELEKLIKERKELELIQETILREELVRAISSQGKSSNDIEASKVNVGHVGKPMAKVLPNNFVDYDLEQVNIPQLFMIRKGQEIKCCSTSAQNRVNTPISKNLKASTLAVSNDCKDDRPRKKSPRGCDGCVRCNKAKVIPADNSVLPEILTSESDAQQKLDLEMQQRVEKAKEKIRNQVKNFEDQIRGLYQ